MEIEIKVPAVGESISEVTIASWAKKDGDHVEADELLCEIESDKATFELNAEASGTLKIVAQEGQTVAVGDKIASIDSEGTPKQAPPAEPEKQAAESPKQQATEQVRGDNATGDANDKNTYATGTPSPAASKILNEKGVNAADVKGSGKDGRITKEDAMKAGQAPQKQEAPQQAQPKASEAAPKAESKPAFTQPTGERSIHRERMSGLRKTIAKRLVEAKNLTAMLTTFNEIDMSATMEMRKKYKDAFKEKYGINLGFMSLFTKAVVEALKEFPAVNAQIDETDLVYHDYMDIGVAVSTPRGLVVPVVRNAEKLSLAEIEKAIADIAVRARDNKLAIEEMTGGTFTITNGGVFGSLMSTPILNAPQAAILGMHNIVERPIAVNGQVVIRPMMYVALSYDHRIIDGRESVSFLVRIKQLIEDPYRLLLEV
jgi:2-oxoglutarate dehydrogenase E2 component (dihydrolipoamide succinyltransferase)